VLLSLIASATAFVASPPLARPDTTYADRHGAVVARQLAFVADLTVETEPFKVGAKSVGEWLAQEDALKILMSQAESSRRLDNGESSTAQRWEVATPIQFPGMVVRSETPMDIRIDKVTPRMSISSGASKTVCDGGPPWAQGLLARIGDIAATSSSNVIELRDAPGGQVIARSRVNLTVRLDIPAVLLPPFIPAGPFEKTGSESIQKLLDKDMRPVLKRWREGYLAWTA